MRQAHAAGACGGRAIEASACSVRAIEAPDMNTYAMVGQTEGKRENMEERKARPTLGRMVAVGVLVVAVLAAATTWARYASEVSGADTVDVATFKVSASGFEEGKDVELFTTVYELDDTTDFTAGVEEKDVAAGKVVAFVPGVGSVALRARPYAVPVLMAAAAAFLAFPVLKRKEKAGR